MRLEFLSTRGGGPAVALSEAIEQGLAADGGLFMPTSLPLVDHGRPCDPARLPSVARVALAGFFEQDRLAAHLPAIADAALDLPAPTTAVKDAGGKLFVLELFHGPTAAFKDFGARFLAECLQRLQPAGAPPTTILVATSGDTGGAVAAAFHRRSWARVVVLFPRNLVSARQEQQLTCWGDNVIALRVAGSFDDCQRMVKEAFVDPALRRHRFSSANSINVGRLLPQLVYYAASSLQVFRQCGEKPNYIVPSGNLGNVSAAIWARLLGYPVGRLVLAHNANRTVPDYLDSGHWQPRKSVPTLASAMDVGNPSNMERLRHQFPTVAELRAQVSADWVDDATIRARISTDFRKFRRIWCPHTATAAEVYQRLPARDRAQPWVLAATAHPAKFNDVVEPLIGQQVPVPPSLARLLDLPAQCVDVDPTLSSLAAALT
ncbi:MAG: threonine synthase [Steroidobacteraceae bacterium]